MSSIAGDYGAEINELLAILNRMTVPAHANADWVKIRNLQRSLDGKGNSLQIAIRRRAAFAEDRRWAESDIHGFERALVLVGGTEFEDGASDGGARLKRRLEAQTSRVEELTSEIEAMDERIRQIKSGIFSTQQILVVTLRGSIDNADVKVRIAKQARLRRQSNQRIAMEIIDETPLWSPSAVMAYRVWEFRDGGLYGAQHRWLNPHLVATCKAGTGVPHTDGRCATVAYGCGIYAMKTPDKLMSLVHTGKNARVAVGLVGLEGRVIEHETGYRAERATILALAVVDRGRIRTIKDASEMAGLLRSPNVLPAPGALWLPVATTTETLRANVIEYLKNHAERNQTWTSASPNE